MVFQSFIHILLRLLLPFKIIVLSACLLFFSLSASATVKIQEFNTKKNIHVILVEDSSTDLTTLSFAFKEAGSALDPKGKEGLTSMMAQLLLERSKEGLDKRALSEKLRNLGVLTGIAHSVTPDNILYSLKAPTEKLKETFDILKIVFTEKVFDAKELDKMQNYDPPEARLATSSERGFASKMLIQNLFQGHPYAIPSYGTLDGRQSVTLTDITTAANQKFTRKNLVFAVVGNISAKNLGSLIDQTFGSLLEKGQSQEMSTPEVLTTGDVKIIPKKSPQSGVMFGQLGIEPKDPDYFPMMILNDILGGKPFTSRLWNEIRENRGLVYGIETEPVRWDKANLLLGGFESDNAKVTEVIQLIRKEWQNVQSTGITIDEFKASKTGLLGSFALNFTHPEGIANYLLMSYLSGLPTDHINKRNQALEKVTLEDVNRVAKSRLEVKKLTFVVVGEPLHPLHPLHSTSHDLPLTDDVKNVQIETSSDLNEKPVSPP